MSAAEVMGGRMRCRNSDQADMLCSRLEAGVASSQKSILELVYGVCRQG